MVVGDIYNKIFLESLTPIPRDIFSIFFQTPQNSTGHILGNPMPQAEKISTALPDSYSGFSDDRSDGQSTGLLVDTVICGRVTLEPICDRS